MDLRLSSPRMSEWTDIGEQLREAREGKGLDLRDVEHSTRIPLATLKALEESDYSIFPSPTYARSFLSQYSEFLGVDAHAWIDSFETGNVLSNVNDHGYLQQHNEHIGDHRYHPEPVQRTRRTKHRDDTSQSVGTGGTSILQTLTVFLLTALLIGGGIYAYTKFEPMLKEAINDSGQNKKVAAPEASTPPKKTSTPEKTSASNTATPPPSKDPKDPPKTKLAQNNSSPATTDTPKKPEKPVIAIPKRQGPPPKAIVIDEDE